MIIPEILCLTTMMCGVAPRVMCCLLTKNNNNLFTNNTFVFLDLQSRPRISRLVPTHSIHTPMAINFKLGSFIKMLLFWLRPTKNEVPIYL